MPQDQHTKHAHEHADKLEKQARAEAQEEDALNNAILHSDSHTGQLGAMAPNEEALQGDAIKEVYALLPDWHKDELRRLKVVPPGERLKTGGVYADLRAPMHGELIATGEETVGSELLIAKSDVDYEIWNKLLHYTNMNI